MRGPSLRGKPAAQRALIATGLLGAAGLAVATLVFIDPEPVTQLEPEPSGESLIPTSAPQTGSTPGSTPGGRANGTPATSAPVSPSPSVTPTRRPSAQGPAITPTAHLEAVSRPDGSFDVVETVTFRKPQNWLLVAPPQPSAGGPTMATAKPRAVNLRLTSDGRPVGTATQEITQQLDLRFDETVQQIELHYRLTGATVRSTPAPAGRALALLAPLSRASDETLRTTLTIRGAAVRNLYCPLLPPNQRLCAASEGPQRGVVSSVAAGQAQVVVQLDLRTS
jgi:hypothetical protein